MKNTRLGYDPDAKTFTLDDDRWNEVIKAIPQPLRKRGPPLATNLFRVRDPFQLMAITTRVQNSWSHSTVPPYSQMQLI